MINKLLDLNTPLTVADRLELARRLVLSRKAFEAIVDPRDGRGCVWVAAEALEFLNNDKR